MAESSRRPLRFVRSTCTEVQEALLALKAERPNWGAKKLLAKLWPQGAPICLRTADRILSRHGLVGNIARPAHEPCRFERQSPNQLWQMDFKAVGTRRFEAFSVLDDCTRFCLCLSPLTDLRSQTTFQALWNLFGEYGMPERLLSDNGAPFNSVRSLGPTPLQARLWLLGIPTSHGRPRHPQTQGKVERFHRTVEQEIGQILRKGDIGQVQEAMGSFRQDYNWERPHEAIHLQVPGARYCPSPRVRPESMPKHEVADGALKRKVDSSGKIVYRMRSYRAGTGLAGEYVELREEQNDLAIFFAGIRIGSLTQLQL
jgi:transposase InsO family protein